MKTILAILVFLVTTQTFAQQSYSDIVYLKNGTVVHGIILEQIPNQSIKIETKDKNIFVFRMEEIEKILKENKESRDGSGKNVVKQRDDYTGYSLIIESHMGTGVNSETAHAMTISGQALNGIEINGICFLGVGAGFDFDEETNNESYLFLGKFFIDMRLFPVKKDISPLIILSSGFAADMSDATYGGFLFNSGAGIKYKLEKKLAVNITLNYKYQNLNFASNGNQFNHPINTPGGLQYLVLNFGVSF
jgi:hypothetical protein